MRFSSWIAYANPNVRGRLRLFCLPYAGAGASIYRPWLRSFPPGIEVCAVQLPGRETRLKESAFQDMKLLVSALAVGLRPYLGMPYVLFGHSMGALVSFELTRELRRMGEPLPLHLFASGCRAPQLPWSGPSLHQGSDSEIKKEMQRLGGTPEEVLRDDEFLDWYLPTLRSDYCVCENYVCASEEPLPCSITAFGGREDEEVSAEDTRAWRLQTQGSFSMRAFPGGHLFLLTHQRLVTQVIAGDLSRLLTETSPSSV